MCVSACGSLKAQARLHEVVLEGFDSCSGRQQVPWKGKTTQIWLGATVRQASSSEPVAQGNIFKATCSQSVNLFFQCWFS